MSKLPSPRGELTGFLLDHLQQGLHSLPVGPRPDDVDDLHLALYLCYELHYRGLPGVDADWEWEPSLLALRRGLEARFESELLASVPREETTVAPEEMDVVLREIEDADDAPALSTYLEREGTLEHFREFAVHRSAYQLKEADPHSWALPRLGGAPKAALVEVQADEYGGGRPERVHATLFAKAMRALGLDPDYGAYLDRIPAVTLATVNVMSLFGLNRRLRGAIVGHLAAFETTSPIPNGRYAKGLRRLGLGDDALDFFDEHVEADSVHENIAVFDMAQSLAVSDPALADDILFGVRALLALEARWAGHVLERWDGGASSLLEPLASAR